MTYEPEITTTDILDALGELGGKVDKLTETLGELGRGMQTGFEGLGRSVAGLDAYVGKVSADIRQIREGLAVAGKEGTQR